MKLEAEIKQQEFKTPYHRMMVNIMFTANWIHKDLSCQLRPFDISLQQHNVLSILKGQYPVPCTLGLIQERMLDRESNATRLVDKLLLKGLVDRCQCPYNRRKVDIVITPTGLELLEKTKPILGTIENRYKTLTAEEATLLGNLLDKLRD
ncbi:MarR family winged helix-turn-helix transcriptional regulator [Adhaeribacter rhizoryzae]|uniref:MarR family transcriptional regulator n=1 Tax=Adhaeribacter rhizoryzae TaxID=2607907 RepID=A0A5M6DNG2_9BACT|nr:MarR family transcriptional regulator [Adhaeribacter rhizoryzae]KAA5547799.1 MarR family transcriptional regulator [Adhaeribacter rhizoryzae]